MIVTHTTNAQGHRRVYLGGKASMECWIEPNIGTAGWTFHAADAVSGSELTTEAKREWASYLLMRLCERLQTTADKLRDIPFDAIAALHDSNPFECRRMASSRRKVLENGYLATPPEKNAVASDFTASDFRAQGLHRP